MTTTLQEPGPAGGGAPARTGLSPRRKRQVTLYAQYVIFVLLALAVILGADWAAISKYFLDFSKMDGQWGRLFGTALVNTILYTLAAYVVGLALGLIVGLMRLSSVLPYRWFALVFIEIFRGLPALLILLLVGFGVPIAFPDMANPPGGVFFNVSVGLGLVAAAYMAETIRAGIQAVPKGQLEAARSLGMSRSRAMISIVIPQAFRIVIPPMTNELVLLFKDSSLVFILGFTADQYELTKFGESLSNTTANSTPYIVAGAAYLTITIPLGFLVRRLEARQAKAR
ncbi:amino acid ABC transporter permease [Spirillospora sp. NPDC047279]|uniref:amino acid ABC transporter permease n=1 Tax=Spirillospora sp. NPDC047279 TaxID=3155478 RepID=UPI0033CB84F5